MRSNLGTMASAHVAAGGLPVAGAAAWWDFSDTSSLTLVSGFIDAATDLSGNGHTLSATAEANRPESTSTTSLGSGLAVAKFDGTNDVMHTAASPVSTAWTWFAATLKRTGPRTGSDSDVLIRIMSRATYVQGSPGDLRAWRGAGGASVITSTQSLWTSANVHAHRITGGTSLDYWISDTQYLTGLSADVGDEQKVLVGADNTSGTVSGDWDVGEIVVYASSLGTSDREAVRDYLKTKWGIT